MHYEAWVFYFERIMMTAIQLCLNSLFLGIGLAMDACAVSMANGLKEPEMHISKNIFISFMFAFFQAGMPLIGYFVGHAFIEYIDIYIPWISLFLLGFLGGKMVVEGFKKKQEKETVNKITFQVILLQSIATSIDALSVGITIAEYALYEAFIFALIVAVVTFAICICATFIGKKFGTRLGNKAIIFGGFVLIAIGLEIFITGII